MIIYPLNRLSLNCEIKIIMLAKNLGLYNCLKWKSLSQFLVYCFVEIFSGNLKHTLLCRSLTFLNLYWILISHPTLAIKAFETPSVSFTLNSDYFWRQLNWKMTQKTDNPFSYVWHFTWSEEVGTCFVFLRIMQSPLPTNFLHHRLWILFLREPQRNISPDDSAYPARCSNGVKRHAVAQEHWHLPQAGKPEGHPMFLSIWMSLSVTGILCVRVTSSLVSRKGNSQETKPHVTRNMI